MSGHVALRFPRSVSQGDGQCACVFALVSSFLFPKTVAFCHFPVILVDEASRLLRLNLWFLSLGVVWLLAGIVAVICSSMLLVQAISDLAWWIGRGLCS